MKRLLVTTALQSSWEAGRPLLFLGEWCRQYDQRAKWKSLDATVLPYHRDVPDAKSPDYRYLNALYEKLLRHLAQRLNEQHAVEHGLRYWRIVIGPWLGYFIHVLSDRWTSINQVVATGEVQETISIQGLQDARPPLDMFDFRDLSNSIEWNHYIYSRILEYLDSIPIKIATDPECLVDSPGESTQTWLRGDSLPASKETRLYRTVRRILGWSLRPSDVHIVNSYLGLRREFLLHLQLQQMPQLPTLLRPTATPVDWNQRRWELAPDELDPFESFVCQMVPEQIPIIYLEGLSSLGDLTSSLRWAKKPKAIVTGNSFYYDDIFKVWCAERVEYGAPLIALQHGGHFGLAESFNHDHQIAISNQFVSWGWSDSTTATVVPIGKVTPPVLRRRIPSRGKGGGLLVTLSRPVHGYQIGSSLQSSQVLDYLEDQFQFIRSLPPAIQEMFTVRLHSVDYGWNYMLRWKDAIPDITIDPGTYAIGDQMAKNRICISTYNATSYLESIAIDIPTVIFWRPNHWPIMESAIQIFEELEEVGVFHRTPESAASHVSNVWDDVSAWWDSSRVVGTVGKFRDAYLAQPRDLVGQIRRCVTSVQSTR